MMGVPLKEVVTFYVPLVVVFIVSGFMGTTFAGACLIFNFVYRNSK